jgi:hypothetical protein
MRKVGAASCGARATNDSVNLFRWGWEWGRGEGCVANRGQLHIRNKKECLGSHYRIVLALVCEVMEN